MTGKTSASIYSNAFNFDEFLAGGVDPRTGLYTFNLSLGGIQSVALNGPSLDVNLQFSPLHTVETGLGAGWMLPLSRYDILNNTLSLASGDSYKTTPTSTGLQLSEPCVENFKVVSTDSDEYELIHKSGMRETLKTVDGGDFAVPTQITAANGTRLFLEYEARGGVPRLVSVKDAERSLLSIAYEDAQVVLKKYPGSVSEAQFTLILNNAHVSDIQLSTSEQWHFAYEEQCGLLCLTEVSSAMGAREFIQYSQTGHALPPASPAPAIPYVISHALFPGQGQPDIVMEYAFSDQNFLGFNGGISWSDELDSLTAAQDDYVYTSTENLVLVDGIHRSTVRTYNKYHLLLCELTRCGSATDSLSTQYHLLPGKSVDEQPAQFRLPLLQTRIYKDEHTKKQRQEVTRTEFDAAGNLLKQIAPSGVTTVSDYFSAAGAEGCPADPLGFVRFEKQRIVSPASGTVPAPTTVTQFRYQLLNGLNATAVQTIVQVAELFYERTAASDTLCLRTDLEYFDLPDDPHLHGQLKKQTHTRQAHSTRSEFSYTLKEGTWRVQTKLSGFDDAHATESRIYSALSGALLSGENGDGVTTRFDYDAVGRPLTETFAPGTPFEAKRHSSYVAATAVLPATLLNTDVSGVQQRVTYDGIGRVIRIEEQDSDLSVNGPLREVFSTRYDSIGQRVEETHTDWLAGVPLPIKQRFVFDDRGQLLTTVYQSGRRQHVNHDPIARKESQWVEGGGKTVTFFNDFGKPDSVEVFDREDQSQGQAKHVYDGLGRTVSQTDPQGNTTTYAYDIFDRLTRSVLPDGTAVETQYAAHSHRPLPIEVKVGGRSLGTQVFDGLSRLTQSEAGGRKTGLLYENGSNRPSIETKPSGERFQYTYEPNLGGRLTRRQALGKKGAPTSTSGLLAEYSYDARLGVLTGCSEQGRKSLFEYSRSGKLTKETSIQGGATRTAEFTSSLAGRSLASTDVLGNQHTTTYDGLGRPKSVTQNGVTADFTYNALEQLDTIQAKDLARGSTLITRLVYDDLGREVSRRFEVGGAVRQVLTSRYTLASKLAQRTLRNGLVIARDETFSYDSRGRLKEYLCAGTNKPRDFQGKEIVRQTFVFDALDNILTLETEFPGAVNLATYAYSPDDPACLVSIEHSHPDYPAAVTLHYDADGHLIRDEQSRTFTYDALGRMTQVTNAEGTILRNYGYDALDKLVELSAPQGPSTQRYYRDGRVANDLSGADATTCVRHGGLLLGQHQSGQNAGVRLSGTDQQQTVMSAVNGDNYTSIAYSPYGHHVAEDGVSLLAGFNGEAFDPLTGLYLLGNGYRAYSPALMRFHSPDSMSPFSAGGLNSYAYCLGDPVNRVDPTGHFSWQSAVGIGLSILGIIASIASFGAATPLALLGLGLGIASGVAGIAGALFTELMPDSPVGEILGYISLVWGVGSVVSGGLAASKAFTQWGSKALTSSSVKVTRFGYRPGALAGGGGKSGLAKGARGGGKAKQGPSTSAQAPRPEKWTLVEDIGNNDFTPNGKPGNVARGKYADFKKGIEEGLSPYKSSKEYLGSRYDPFPNYGGSNRVISDVRVSNQAAISAAKKTGEVPVLLSEPVHVHARLGGFDRVFFMEFKTEMRVVIKQIGRHDPEW